MASVVAAAPVEITTYNADGDHRRRCCPRGAATADVGVMMMMAGERGGEAMARRRRGDGEATTRRRRGEYKATTRQQECEGNRLWRQVAGATR
jgi:hypothetical protein